MPKFLYGTTTSRGGFWRAGRSVLALAGLVGVGPTALAVDSTFPLAGAPVLLSQVTNNEAAIFYQSMRFNRGLNAWNVEAWVSNQSTRTLQGPLVLRIESFANTTGPIDADGKDNSGMPFYDLTANVTAGRLEPGQRSLARTLTLARGAGAPSLQAHLFEKRNSTALTVAITRTLNEVGQPLPGVQVIDLQTSNTNLTEPDFGAITLTGTAGPQAWKFAAPGFLPVWRQETLSSSSILTVPSPRLTPMDTNTVTLTPIDGGSIGTGTVRVSFPPGAFVQNSTARLTLLTSQTLPAPLPLGWSPLQGFWLQFGAEPAIAGPGTLVPWGVIGSGEVATLVHWNETNLQWQVVQAVAGNGTNAVSVSIAGSGAFALVVADTGPAAPPPMQPGQNLDAAIGNAVDYGLLKVAGSVQPASGPANRNPDLVTATALLNVTSSAGALTSGLMLHVQIHEDYRLRDGTHRITPPYDTFVLAYQRPPTGNPGSLVASFPLRPLLLFGPEALDTAIIEANVFGPTNFNGALLDSSGGELYNEGIRIVAATGDVSGLQASSLRSLSPTNFLDWSSNGVSILRAFDLMVAGVQQGRRLVFQAEALPTNALFVLAKVLSRDGVYGLEPRERLISDGAGRVSSLEPPAGPSLPGITGASEYVLVQVSAGQGLVKGVARNSSGEPSAGLLVQTTGAPWATLSDSGGNYTLIAATGSVQLSILELSSGDRGQVTTLLSGATGVANADLAPIVSGLLATLVTPTNGAVGVPSVSPVVVSFSSAINPGSFGTNGIELLDNSNMMVAGNLSLNLQNTVATLLPNSPLAAGIQHTVVVSTNLTSVNGQALAGVTKFTFTTASDALNRTAGQLISYEPTNGVARVEGGPGIADANAPVILLNETTGRSSTVLSNPDGSITNSIEAEVDDFISVVLVNQNGTRQTVPVSRQIYNDGSVGLFNAGGILEAQSDAGPVQVIVEPGAIPSKTRFNLQLQSMDQILAAVGGILPENAAIVGGLRIDVSGDALQQQMDFTYPISAEALHLGVNERPEDRAFVLCQPIQVDGVTVYNIVDRMHYENGRLVTHSPPFPGLLSSSLAVLVEYSVGFSVSLTVSGRVGAALDTIATSLSDAQITAGSPSTTPPIFGVPFPIVTADPGSTAGAARPGLRPGTFVARGNSQGYFAMLIPFNVYDSDAIALRATSGNLPGLVGRKTIVPPPAGAPPVSTAGIVIPLPQGTSSGVLDMMPPLIGALPQSAVLPVNQDARVTFNVRDNLTQPTLRRVEVDLAHSFHVLTGQLLDPSEFLTPQIGAVSNINATTIEVPVVFNVRTAAVVVAKATAQDAANNFRTSSFVLFFGAPPSGPSTNAITSSDPNDTAGPYVVSSVPGAGEVISANDFFTIRFSEPVDPSITTNGAVQISGISNLPYVELSANQLQIKVYPGGLSQGQSYTLTINNRVKDLSGNAFDQDPTTPAQEPFELNFRTAPATPTSLSQIQNGAGTVLLGEFAYTIDRRDNQANGALVSANLQDPSNITFSSATLPPYPRTLVLIPGYNFKRTPGAVTQTNTPLLLVAGGLIGPDQPGQWLWVFDLSEPSNPVRLAGSLATLDPVTALSVVKWDPPRLSLGLNPAEGGYIEELNLQAFILGSNYGDQDWAAAKKPPANGGYFPGVDGNGDGDYVDAGDQLPVPMRSGLFGLEATTYAAANRILTDFDSAFGGALLVATLGRQGTNESRFQVLMYQGQPVGDGSTDQGSVVFTNRQAFRVVLDPSFPIRDATGVRVASVAIVAVDDKLALIDLTNPVRPQIVNSIGLGTNAGTIFSIQRSGADEYAVSTGAAIYTLRRSLMSLSANPNSGSPAIIDVYPTGSNRRSFGAAGVQFVAANGNGVQLVERPPHLSVIQVPTQPPRSASEIKALGDPEISQYVSDAVESPFLLPTVVVPVSPACPEGIASANPASHHYVLISAKGGLGPQLTVAAESLDAQGRLITPKSSWFPPVMLTDKAPALGLAGAQPDVHALVARRLSDDPKSRFYDLFLSDPFVLVRETLWPSNMTQLQAISGREALWSGNFARFSLEPDQGPPRLSSYLGAIDGKTFKPGLSRTYLSLSGQYLGTPNPSFNTASPDIAGVNAQSGEFHQKTVDFSLPGRHQDLVLTRTYASRSRFAGPLGGGWDFNYNARLFEIPQIDVPAGFHDCMTYFGNSALDRVAGPGDVLLIDGVGDVNLFKLISAENNNLTNLTLYSADPALAQFGYTSDNIGAWYCSPEGEFFVLYKFKDNSWMTVSPAGVRAYFRADGQLRQIIGVYADSRISLLYRPDGKLSRVTGDRGQYLEFGYYGLAGETSGNVDQVTSKRLEVGLIARIQANEAAGVVGQTDYSYDENGDLLTVAPQNESLMKYGYDPTPPHQITALGRVDGTEWPAETIHYSDGLVDKVTNLGQDIAYGGALKTAKDCYDAPERTVTVKIGDYPAATIKVDNRGRPTEMANRTVEADDSGRITKTGDDEASTVLTYDKDNAVYRFRGHLLRAEQPGKPAFVTTFGYDGSAFNRVSSITNTEGIVTSFEYDSNGNYVDTVLETTGPVKKTYHLNNFGQCTDESIEDSSQSPVHTLTHTFAFDDEGMPNGEHWGELPNTTATFTAGKVSAFGNGTFQYTPAYTSDDQLQALSGTGLPTIGFGHQDGFISSHTISSGSSLIRREVTFDANDKKRVKSVTTTETGLPVTITTASYDGNGRVQSLDTDGEHSVFTFAGSRVTGLRAPGISRLVSYRGSQATNLTEQGISTDIQYDDQGRLSSLTRQGVTATFVFNSGNQVANKTLSSDSGPLEQETYMYDGAGRLESTEAGGVTRTFTHFGDGSIRRFSIDGNALTEWERDSAGRLTALKLPGLAEFDFASFDAGTGQPKTETIKYFPSTGGSIAFVSYNRTLGYDAVGRLASVTWPCGTWNYEYDDFGNLTNQTDPDGVSRSQSYSPDGALLGTIFTDGSSVSYTYDSGRRLQSVGAMSFELDSEKLVSHIAYPDATTSDFLDRNQFFEPQEVVHGGIIQNISWNEDGRLEQINVPNNGDSLNYDYDGLGRITNIVFNDYTLGIGYDNKGQLNSETTHTVDPSIPDRTWSANFNSRNHLLGETYPSQLAIDWQPRPNGQASSATAVGISEIDWAGPGLLEAVTFQGGVRSVRSYDPSLRLTAILFLTGPLTSPTTNAAFIYGLTPGGRLVFEQRLHENRYDVVTRNSPGQGMRIINFAFSATNALGAGATCVITGFDFDDNGELLPPSAAAGADARGFVPDFNVTGGRVVSAGGTPVTYNAQGSVEQVPVWVRLPDQTNLVQETAVLTYDGMGMLSQVQRGDLGNQVQVTYTRDGLGRIVLRQVDGPADRCHPGTRQYVWKGSQLIEEYEKTGITFALLRRYIYVDDDLVLVQASASAGGALSNYVPLVNLNGSVCGYLATDGTLLETICFGAYGTPVTLRATNGALSETEHSSIGFTLLFHGAFYDEDTGLYQMGERNFHPQLGRFLQRDSHLYSESLALYSAFNGDPAGRTDPAGTASLDLVTSPSLEPETVGAQDSLQAAVENLRGSGGEVLAAEGRGSLAMRRLLKAVSIYSAEQFNDSASTEVLAADQQKLGAGILQNGSDLRRDRTLLATLKAHSYSPEGKDFSLHYLASGGAAADTRELQSDSHFAKRFSAGMLVKQYKRLVSSSKARQDFDPGLVWEQQREATLSIVNDATSLAVMPVDCYLNRTLASDDRGPINAARGLLQISDGLSSGFGLYYKAAHLRDLKVLQFSASKVGVIGSVRNLWKGSSMISASFSAGEKIGRGLLLISRDRVNGMPVRQALETFDNNGGYLTCFAGVLSYFGYDKAAHLIERRDTLEGEHILEPLKDLVNEYNATPQRLQDIYNGLDYP